MFEIDITQLNWWAILVSTLVAFVLGGIWYGPLFGNLWLKELKTTKFEMEPSLTPFLVTFVTTFVTCLIMAMMVNALRTETWWEGALIGGVFGIAFIACSNISDGAFCRWSWKFVAIQSTYRVIYCVIMGVILTIW
ncbi:MAG: DUF1761 domain-containing protein [Gammaproteobacteria bacterium]|nr:DUF1761 domain-containing protein [Gammaproteobacteria bacterium]